VALCECVRQDEANSEVAHVLDGGGSARGLFRVIACITGRISIVVTAPPRREIEKSQQNLSTAVLLTSHLFIVYSAHLYSCLQHFLQVWFLWCQRSTLARFLCEPGEV
jgi:hypothetical protein